MSIALQSAANRKADAGFNLYQPVEKCASCEEGTNIVRLIEGSALELKT